MSLKVCGLITIGRNWGIYSVRYEARKRMSLEYIVHVSPSEHPERGVPGTNIPPGDGSPV